MWRANHSQVSCTRPAPSSKKRRPAAVHHDAVGIEQDDRRGARAARVDRLDVHAVPLAGGVRAERPRHRDAVAGVEARARRQQRDALPARAEMLAHHVAVALEAAAGEHHGVGGDDLAAAHPHAADRAALADQPFRRAGVAQHYARVLRGARELAEDRCAAADRLDARWALGEIVGRLVELDAVRGDPRNGRRRVVGEAGEVALVALEPRRLQHVVHEARLDAVRSRHAHIGRRPAGVAAGLVRGGLVDQRDGDGQVPRARLLDRRQRGREPGGALADDDDVNRFAVHVASPPAAPYAHKRRQASLHLFQRSRLR